MSHSSRVPEKQVDWDLHTAGFPCHFGSSVLASAVHAAREVCSRVALQQPSPEPGGPPAPVSTWALAMQHAEPGSETGI